MVLVVVVVVVVVVMLMMMMVLISIITIMMSQIGSLQSVLGPIGDSSPTLTQLLGFPALSLIFILETCSSHALGSASYSRNELWPIFL